MNEKILLIGPQGAGKSTQGKLLAEYLHIPHISTGDIFRDLSTDSSAEAKRIREILSAGQLVDDETTSTIVKKRLQNPDCQKGFIMDGYPRTLEQISFFDPEFTKVLYLELSDEEATKRLMQRGREDDIPELIAQRLRIYHDQTDPILDYYEKRGLLKKIDGARDISIIQQDLRGLFS